MPLIIIDLWLGDEGWNTETFLKWIKYNAYNNF